MKEFREWAEGSGRNRYQQLNCAAELCTIQQSCLQIVLDYTTLILYFAFMCQKLHRYLYINMNYADVYDPQ